MASTYTKVIIGILTLLIASSIIYITFSNSVKMRIDEDKSTFYTKDLDADGNPVGRWKVSGREYSKLMDGTSNMNRRTSEITVEEFIDEEAETVRIVRTTPYIRGPIIIDEWFFDGKIDDVELFPVSHKIRILNGKGFYYKYEVRDLTYDGETIKLNGDQVSMNFGRNMKVTWWEGYRLGWIYKTSKSMYVKSEKLTSDDKTFNVRLFDPELSNMIKTYDNKTLTAILKDSGVTKAVVKLNTGQKLSVFRGPDRKVWAIEYNNTDKNLTLGDVITNVTLYDLNQNSKVIQRDYVFKTNKRYIKKVPVTRKDCVFNTSLNNGTWDCSDVFDYNKNVSKDNWVVANNQSLIPVGITEIGMFTEVLPGDKVEWVIAVRKVSIPEWAVWEDSYNVGLKFFYDFETQTGTNVVNRVDPGTLDMTVTSNWNSTGHIGGGFTPQKTQGIVGKYTFTDTGQFTLNWWMERIGIWQGTNIYFFGWQNGTTWFHMRGSAAPDKVRGLVVDGGGAQYLDPGGSLNAAGVPLNNWTMFTVTATSTAVKLYMDGALQETEVTDGTSIKDANIYLFSYESEPANPSASYNTTYDMYSLWNRTLNDTDVVSLYNNGAGITFPTAVADSCDCPGSGDWTVNVDDNCVISSPCDLSGQYLIFSGGSGNFTTTALITALGSLNGTSGQAWQNQGGVAYGA